MEALSVVWSCISVCFMSFIYYTFRMRFIVWTLLYGSKANVRNCISVCFMSFIFYTFKMSFIVWTLLHWGTVLCEAVFLSVLWVYILIEHAISNRFCAVISTKYIPIISFIVQIFKESVPLSCMSKLVSDLFRDLLLNLYFPKTYVWYIEWVLYITKYKIVHHMQTTRNIYHYKYILEMGVYSKPPSWREAPGGACPMEDTHILKMLQRQALKSEAFDSGMIKIMAMTMMVNRSSAENKNESNSNFEITSFYSVSVVSLIEIVQQTNLILMISVTNLSVNCLEILFNVALSVAGPTPKTFDVWLSALFIVRYDVTKRVGVPTMWHCMYVNKQWLLHSRPSRAQLSTLIST